MFKNAPMSRNYCRKVRIREIVDVVAVDREPAYSVSCFPRWTRPQSALCDARYLKCGKVCGNQTCTVAIAFGVRDFRLDLKEETRP
jgi:hypothetical protein